METTQLYAIAAGGIALLLVLINLRPYVTQSIDTLTLMISKHLIYPQFLYRHCYLGPWS